MAVARGEGCRRRRTGLRAGSSRRTGRPRRRRGAGLLTDARACTPQVVVLEKGRYTKAADLSLKEREAVDSMYESGSLMTTEDAGARSGRRPAAGPVAAARWPPHATLAPCHQGQRATTGRHMCCMYGLVSTPSRSGAAAACHACMPVHPGAPRAHAHAAAFPLPGAVPGRCTTAHATCRRHTPRACVRCEHPGGRDAGRRHAHQLAGKLPHARACAPRVGLRARPDGLRVAALRPRAGRRLAALRRHHR